MMVVASNRATEPRELSCCVVQAELQQPTSDHSVYSGLNVNLKAYFNINESVFKVLVAAGEGSAAARGSPAA